MNDGWIEWVWSEEKPYPCLDCDTRIDVKFSDGSIDETGQRLSFWANEPNSFDPLNRFVHILSSITHYKLAEGN